MINEYQDFSSAERQDDQRESLTSNDIIIQDHLDQLYFVTYKYMFGKAATVTEQSYESVLHLLRLKGTITDYAYEYDSVGRLHLHVIFKSRKNILLRQFQRKGYHCCIKNVYDETQLVHYIHKVSKTPIDNTVYMF